MTAMSATQLLERAAILLDLEEGEWVVAVSLRGGRVRRVVSHPAPIGPHERPHAWGRGELSDLREHDEAAA